MKICYKFGIIVSSYFLLLGLELGQLRKKREREELVSSVLSRIFYFRLNFARNYIG